VQQPLLLITPEGKEEETLIRLSRVGFDHTLGILDGGIEAWKKAGFETDAIETVSPATFAQDYTNKPVIDARRPGEYQAEHIEGAQNIPLDFINELYQEVPKETSFYIHCAGGYRSVILSSILKARGYHNMINVAEGMAGIRKTNVKLTAFVCPSQL
jgi:rhodanese-related sulfurtransferase